MCHNPFSSLHKWCVGLGRVFANKLKAHHPRRRNPAILRGTAVGIPRGIHPHIYNPEVVREIPVAVVDDSRTPASRKLVMTASATPAMQIYAYCANMAEAKELMAEGKVYGILQLPRLRKEPWPGIPAHAAFYSDMSLLLRYRAFVAALTDIQIEIIQEVTGEKIASTGLSSLAGCLAPINSGNFLGDTEQGFASFVIPGIVILILQQSMVLGVSTLGEVHRASADAENGGIDPLEPQGVPVSAQIWGKALAVTVLHPLHHLCAPLHTRDVQPAALRLGARLSPIRVPPAPGLRFHGPGVGDTDERAREPLHIHRLHVGVLPLPLSGLIGRATP